MLGNLQPTHTFRLLVSPETRERLKKKGIQLKDHAHCTLACTNGDKERQIREKGAHLKRLLNGQTLTVNGVKELYNSRDPQNPLYGVTLSLGENEKRLHTELSTILNEHICPEFNGITYLWNCDETEGPIQRILLHITLGAGRECKEAAEALLKDEFEFTFDQVDYKLTGYHDPSYVIALTQPGSVVNSGLYAKTQSPQRDENEEKTEEEKQVLGMGNK